MGSLPSSVGDEGRARRMIAMCDKNVVEHPACDCCPHTDLSDIERDPANPRSMERVS